MPRKSSNSSARFSAGSKRVPSANLAGLEVEPRDAGRVGLIENRNAFAVENQRVLRGCHLAGKRSVNAVTGQEIGELWSRGQVVDGQELEVASVCHDAQQRAAYATCSVKDKGNRHGVRWADRRGENSISFEVGRWLSARGVLGYSEKR